MATLATPYNPSVTNEVGIGTTGCDLKTSRKAQEIAHRQQGVYFTAGVHPHNAKECGEATLDSLRELADDTLCVAVGECGLDFNRNFSPAEVQEEWFDKQVGGMPSQSSLGAVLWWGVRGLGRDALSVSVAGHPGLETVTMLQFVGSSAWSVDEDW